MRSVAILVFLILIAHASFAQTKKHSAGYYFNKGAIYLVMPGEKSDSLAKVAIGWYTKAIETDHRYWYAYRNRAALYSFLRLYKKQIADLKLGIKYSNKIEWPYFYSFLGTAYYNDGDLNDAIKKINLALSYYPHSANLYLYRAKSYWKLNQKGKACHDYLIAIKQDSTLVKEKEFITCN